MARVSWDNVLILQTSFLGDTVLTLPLIGEGAFYQTLGKRRGRAFGVVSGWVALWFLLHWADGMLLGSERWRYWTPFLDPAPFACYLR